MDLDENENSSLVTAVSDDQQESSDSASFSIPSLEFSDGLAAAASSLDMEDNLSPSCSALGPETGSMSTEVPGLKDEQMLEADGEQPERTPDAFLNPITSDPQIKNQTLKEMTLILRITVS